MLGYVLLLLTVASANTQCPEHSFLGCVLRLRAYRVPFERNIMTLVFSVKTEAKLLQTCKAYSSVLPCFREKIVDCGDQKQHRLLKEVEKTLMFMCTPFSLKRQRSLITHQKCVSSVLSMPASTGCKLADHAEGEQVISCKRRCMTNRDDIMCMVKAWISEQNVCTLRDIQTKCGREAGDLYKDLQSFIYEPKFPVVCEVEEFPTSPPSTTTEPVDEVVIDTNISGNSVYPTNTVFHRPMKKIIKQVESITTALPNIPSTLPSTVVRLTTQRPVVWTKKPSAKKVAYNKSAWNQKPARKPKKPSLPPIRLTDAPTSEPTTLGITEMTPRTHQVISLLKNLLPDNLPEKLTYLLENSLIKHSIRPEDLTKRITTPATIEYSSERPRTSLRTTSVTATEPTTRWRPWYLGGY